MRVYQAGLQIQAEEENQVVKMRLMKKEKIWRKNYLAVIKELGQGS
jgi:hypothetical protein